MTMLQTSEQEYDGDALRLSVFFVMRGVRCEWKESVRLKANLFSFNTK